MSLTHQSRHHLVSVGSAPAWAERDTGNTVPFSEPVFLLRARDQLAPLALQYYLNELPLSHPHRGAAQKSLKAMEDYQRSHPGRAIPNLRPHQTLMTTPDGEPALVADDGAVPPDEPVILLRGSDRFAVSALSRYALLANTAEQRDIALGKIEQFERHQSINPEAVLQEEKGSFDHALGL